MTEQDSSKNSRKRFYLMRIFMAGLMSALYGNNKPTNPRALNDDIETFFALGGDVKEAREKYQLGLGTGTKYQETNPDDKNS